MTRAYRSAWPIMINRFIGECEMPLSKVVAPLKGRNSCSLGPFCSNKLDRLARLRRSWLLTTSLSATEENRWRIVILEALALESAFGSVYLGCVRRLCVWLLQEVQNLRTTSLLLPLFVNKPYNHRLIQDKINYAVIILETKPQQSLNIYTRNKPSEIGLGKSVIEGQWHRGTTWAADRNRMLREARWLLVHNIWRPREHKILQLQNWCVLCYFLFLYPPCLCLYLSIDTFSSVFIFALRSLFTGYMVEPRVSRVPCSFYCKATPHIVQGRVIHFLPDSAQLFINCCSLG